jgi:2-aminoadipate transaminase
MWLASPSGMKKTAISELGRRVKAPPISWLMELALSRPRLISLAAGFTDNETLPVGQVRELLNGILSSRKSGQPALQYGSTAGDPVLRQLTAADFSLLDGAPDPHRTHSPERLIITSGSQQMLYMAVEVLCDAGDIVLVEDPTYFVFLGILQARGVACRGVRLEHDGLNVAHLAQVLERLKRAGELGRVKMIYLVTYHQNPTGVTTSFEKKIEVLKVLRRFEKAAGHPIYLLEDAAYRELRFRGNDIKSALAVKGYSDRVIYAGTYSKPFATGVRVGFSILPQAIFEPVLHLKGNHDFGTSNLLQKLIAQAITSGKYEEHLATLQKRYAHKARVMRRALQEHFPKNVELWEPGGGLYYWARLPRSVKTGTTSKLFQTALARDVLYVPGELCYCDDPTRHKPNHEMRISFGAATEESIKAGVARLGGVLRELMGQ